ncbi:VanZ family protein [Microvirga massiliensis]|uniref:VanZ family protein n=1 Tax=Microvirga massiliensis TaxID=1033741 RepID=UPI0007C7EB96|nr:VanZ family protein [Microvirga massiliensis]
MLSKLSRWAAWLLVIAIAIFTLSPIGLRPTTAAPANLERFVAFAALGGAFWLGYPNRRFGSLLLAIGIAGLLEILQHVAPGRHGEFRDFVVKSFGLMSGAVCAQVLDWLVNGIATTHRPDERGSDADIAAKQDAAQMGETRA